ILTEANPWWLSAVAGHDRAAWTASNRTLRDRQRYDLGYRSHILDDIAADQPDGSLVVLTGPRRAGKTVAILDVAAALCRGSQVDPRQVVYAPCDGLSARDLRRIITLGRALTRSVDAAGPRRRVWLFDEISGIVGWTSALKMARDNSDFGDDTVVATGSRWVTTEDLQGNLLAGRAGSGRGRRVRQLMPMSFRDYAAVTRPDLPLPPVVPPGQLDQRQAVAALTGLSFSLDQYDLAWQDYLTSGGFPRAVAEHQREGAVSPAYLRDLLAWLRADVDPDGPTESVPLLLAGLAVRMTSPLSVVGAAAELGYPGRRAFERRIDRLINSHAALRCRQRDERGNLVAGALAKVYLTDPLLAWIPSLVSPGLPAPLFPALSEAVLAVTLARVVDQHEEGRWVADDTVGYLRTGSGNEIDLGPVRLPTAAGSELTTPIESKWIRHIQGCPPPPRLRPSCRGPTCGARTIDSGRARAVHWGCGESPCEPCDNGPSESGGLAPRHTPPRHTPHSSAISTTSPQV
ncbi:MAG: AAA family ATPase, partial [Propionibacteriaceae bacterium]|nr:AAA family ATPase [Propionibacteriaceae bacterium]